MPWHSLARSAITFRPAIERAGGVLLLAAAAFFLYQSTAFAGMVPTLQSSFGINFGS